MNDNKVTPDLEKPDPLKVFKKHAKMSWPWEWVEDHGALNYGEFKKIWDKHVPKNGYYTAQLDKQHELMHQVNALQKELLETRAAWKKDRDNLQVKRLEAEKELLELKAENEELSLQLQVATTNDQIIESELMRATELLRIAYRYIPSYAFKLIKEIESFLSKSKID